MPSRHTDLHVKLKYNANMIACILWPSDTPQ